MTRLGMFEPLTLHKTPEYLFAGKRPGWNFSGLERVDLPPNSGGHSYTEFRRKDGSVSAVVLTSLLINATETPDHET